MLSSALKFERFLACDGYDARAEPQSPYPKGYCAGQLIEKGAGLDLPRGDGGGVAQENEPELV